MKCRGILWTVALLAGLVPALAGVAPAQAETAAAFYKGKVVKLVVGYGAGGGYDSYARMLAPYLERRLGATVVVENRPGGGGMVAISQLASGTGDGLILVLANLEAAALGQILDNPGIRFDISALPVIARVVAEPKVVLLSSDSPFKTIADLRSAGRAIKWAAGAKTDGIADSVAVFCEALGLPAEIIIGYKGTKEAGLAVIRGEADGLALSTGSAAKLVHKGGFAALAVLGRKRAVDMPDVPTIFELADLDAAQARWIDVHAGLDGLGRSLLAGPGTPADRLAFLRTAADAVLTDPALIAEAQSRQRMIDYAGHEEVEALIAQNVSGLSLDEIDRLRDVILTKYY